MQSYRVDFGAIPWEEPFPGIRQRVVQDGGRRLRLVEYDASMAPHWCEKGHYGHLLEGRFEIEFDDAKVIFEAGDGVFIPDGPEHRHRAVVLTDKVVAVFVEDL